MRKILVTNNFDLMQPIGYLMLDDEVDVPIDSVFALQYLIQRRKEDDTPSKIEVTSVGLISDDNYTAFLRHERAEREKDGQ